MPCPVRIAQLKLTAFRLNDKSINLCVFGRYNRYHSQELAPTSIQHSVNRVQFSSGVSVRLDERAFTLPRKGLVARSNSDVENEVCNTPLKREQVAQLQQQVMRVSFVARNYCILQLIRGLNSRVDSHSFLH